MHGIEGRRDQADGLPWIVLAAGLTGTATALSMQIWMNAINYPYIISGKPFISLPAFIPVGFELTVLLASFGAFFGMLALNGLPRFSNPVFTDPRFDRATDDRFFLFIHSRDPKFDRDGVTRLLGELGGSHVGNIDEDTSGLAIPKTDLDHRGGVRPVGHRTALGDRSDAGDQKRQPAISRVLRHGFLTLQGWQQTTTLFADSRAMRPDVPGTVAVGQYDEAISISTPESTWPSCRDAIAGGRRNWCERC